MEDRTAHKMPPVPSVSADLAGSAPPIGRSEAVMLVKHRSVCSGAILVPVMMRSPNLSSDDEGLGVAQLHPFIAGNVGAGDNFGRD